MNKQPTDHPEPRSIGGSFFGGDSDVRDSLVVGRDLTIQGVSAADLDKITRLVLDALRSAKTIAIAGGAGNTTVLAVDDRPHVVVSREQGAALARRTASSADIERPVDAYLAGLVMHRDFGPWDTRYVPLAGDAARAVAPEGWAGNIPVELCALRPRGEGPEQRIERVRIPDVAAAVREYPQFVLLGEPGAGKTTVLQKIALDAARARLQDDAAPAPLFVRLGSHRDDAAPFDFLARAWRSRVGTDFGDELRAGRVLLLLDALNEMGRARYAERVAAWRDFAHRWEGVRMVFTCRTLDYRNPLGLQQVETNRLDDDRIRDFLSRCVPDHAPALWDALSRHPHGLLDLARNPFLLAVVAWIYAESPQTGLPPNRGQLLARLVDRLIRREGEWRTHADWIAAPAQERALSALAWTLQAQGEGTSLPAADALQAIPPQVTVAGRAYETAPETVLRLGCAATLLEWTPEDQVRFYHHLVQEYFTARELLRRFDDGEAPSTGSGQDLSALWKAPWLAREMPEPTGLGEWDPIPPPPPTGWEETSIVAAGLAGDPAGFVEAVRAVNPVLAGRCLEEGAAAVPPALREGLQADLLAGMEDRRVHLRARIAAGRVLGRLGDPRFVSSTRERDGARYIPPPLVRVPAGRYAIGSPWWDRQAYEDERPRHKVDLAAFSIGRYPVTVAEYACFVEAGGYEQARYWRTEAARAWLRGEETEGGAIAGILDTRQTLLGSGRSLEEWAEELGWRPQVLEGWRALTAMSEEEARAALRPAYAERSRREPAWWDDAAYSGPNQPVVGVTWYEANAYCAWLSEMVGHPCRLPTEAEWEAAARGGRVRRYPWGYRFDPARANTVEGRVLGTTPVGLYPRGVGPLGLWDGAGNVWEWTSSLYQPYPYRPDDGREDPSASGRRVLRGGSWGNNSRLARCASRTLSHPDLFHDYYGFRVVRLGSPVF